MASQGANGLRCYFNRFDDLAEESLGCLRALLADDSFSKGPLPVFLFGISMGGATAVRMAQIDVLLTAQTTVPTHPLSQLTARLILALRSRAWAGRPLPGCRAVCPDALARRSAEAVDLSVH